MLLKTHEWNYIGMNKKEKSFSPKVSFFEDGRIALWTNKGDSKWIVSPDGEFDSGYVWKCS